jgi:hypothetical protein
MVGIANNYFEFKRCVAELYSEKFKKMLVDRTEDAYNQLVNNYKEISMIILDKLVGGIGRVVEEYAKKCTIQNIKWETVEEIVAKGTETLEK